MWTSHADLTNMRFIFHTCHFYVCVMQNLLSYQFLSSLSQNNNSLSDLMVTAMLYYFKGIIRGRKIRL